MRLEEIGCECAFLSRCIAYQTDFYYCFLLLSCAVIDDESKSLSQSSISISIHIKIVFESDKILQLIAFRSASITTTRDCVCFASYHFSRLSSVRNDV